MVLETFVKAKNYANSFILLILDVALQVDQMGTWMRMGPWSHSRTIKISSRITTAISPYRIQVSSTRHKTVKSKTKTSFSQLFKKIFSFSSFDWFVTCWFCDMLKVSLVGPPWAVPWPSPTSRLPLVITFHRFAACKKIQNTWEHYKFCFDLTC